MDFDLTPLKHLIKRDLTKREFGFFFIRNGKKIPARKVFFDSEDAIVEYFNTQKPDHAYIGPECHNQDFLNWSGHELVFDIDIDQYDDVRYCGCRGKDHICPDCWQLIRNAGQYLRDVIEEDFGGHDYHFVFSGRRGIHLWFTDQKFFEWSRAQRQVILDACRLIKGKGLSAKVIRPINRRTPLSNIIIRKYKSRIYNYIDKPFILHASKKTMTAIGLNDYRYNQINRKIRKPTFKNQKLFNNLIFDQLNKFDRRIKGNIVVHGAPRIDEPCTTDINRLMRVPGSTHASTGFEVRFLTDSLEYPI